MRSRTVTPKVIATKHSHSHLYEYTFICRWTIAATASAQWPNCNLKKLNMCFIQWMAILYIRFIAEIKGNVTLFFCCWWVSCFLCVSFSICVCVSACSRIQVPCRACNYCPASFHFCRPNSHFHYMHFVRARPKAPKNHFQINIVVILAFGIP